MRAAAAAEAPVSVSLFDYRQAQELSAADPSFVALIMAAMRRADSANARALILAFPDVAHELLQRNKAPGGLLAGEAAPEDLRIPDEDP